MNASHEDAAARPDAPLAALTGATGFIGRHLVVALHQAGFRVRLLLRPEGLTFSTLGDGPTLRNCIIFSASVQRARFNVVF
jgi:nucleoside-diphosphate-sugar epimerase